MPTAPPEARLPARHFAPPNDLAALPPAQRDAKIMALCDAAIAALYQARDVESVVTLRNVAEAFATYTRKMKAAVDAQAQCQLVVLLAEARIGAELKAAQERGEVADKADNLRRGPKSEARTSEKATLTEIGIPRQRAAEMKKLAEAGEDRIRDEVARAKDERRRPSRRNILGAIPSIAERPPEVSRFALWLRTGAELLRQVGDPSDFASLMSTHGVSIDIDALRHVVTFLSAMEEEV